MSNKPRACLARNVIVGVLLLLLSGVVGGVASAQDATLLWPIIFSGNVTVGGQPAADGLVVVARMGGVNAGSATTQGGRYGGLTVGTTHRDMVGRTITFHLDGEVAQETEVFEEFIQPVTRTRDLTFPASQPTPTPTPAPTATPVPTATPAPTATPVPTATPRPTPTALLPAVGDASVSEMPGAAMAAGALLLLVGVTVLRVTRRKTEGIR
ncbi:MAG: hypothetical protein HW388_291 [Dehalococcoidia bacterium]|nr:hypothetical protein [Dehalococcoidia bacterium]